MASKRMSNVRYSSEDSACSDEDNMFSQYLKRPKNMRLKTNAEYRKNRLNSSSCEENGKNNMTYNKRGCNSKNAIMARENRIKKKMYVKGLESEINSLKKENRKMRLTLGTQSSYVSDLESEINYLRNVLANTSEISLLLNSIQNNTGLSVNSSLCQLSKYDKRDSLTKKRKRADIGFTMNTPSKMRKSENSYENFAIRRLPIARKTPWPFENDDEINDNFNVTPPASVSSTSSVLDECPPSPFNVDIPSDFFDDYPNTFNNVELSTYSIPDLEIDKLPNVLEDNPISPCHSPDINMECTTSDHTYSSKPELTNDASSDQYGVCLHISNKKVSLEFCSKCNEKAIFGWKAVTC